MSPDHEDLDPMSEPEIAALAALDRRGRAAGAALMTAAEAPPDDIRLVRLPDGRAHRRRPGRPWLLVAAVLIVVAAIAGSLLARHDDESPPVTNGQPSYLLPRWLPEGYEPFLVLTTAIAQQYNDAPPDGQVVVYGLPNEADPWGGATITVARLETVWSQSLEGEPVTIAGRPGELQSVGDVEFVTWGVDGATYAVVGQRLRSELVLEAAEAAGPEPSLDPATLPPGFEVIARGPASSTLGVPSQPSFLAPDTLVAYYGPAGAGAGDAERFIRIVERPGDAVDVDLARPWAAESRTGEVRGGHAVIGSTQTPGFPFERYVQWREPSGLLMTAVGRGVSEDELLRLVAELGLARDGEIEGLLAEHGIQSQNAVTEGDDSATESIPAESIVSTDVATGDRAGTGWTLTATSAESGDVGLELHIGGKVESLTWDAVDGPGDMRLSPQVVYGQTERAVFAASDGLVARATIEHLGMASPTEMAMYPVALNGQAFTAFIGFVPVEDETIITVTSYDAAGGELERAEIGPRGQVQPRP